MTKRRDTELSIVAYAAEVLNDYVAVFDEYNSVLAEIYDLAVYLNIIRPVEPFVNAMTYFFKNGDKLNLVVSQLHKMCEE